MLTDSSRLDCRENPVGTTNVEETSDNGKSWVGGNRLCNQWANLYGGLEDSFPIYDNPEGTPEKKDEYIGVAVYGFVPFSVVD
jgi:hypothetical protein